MTTTVLEFPTVKPPAAAKPREHIQYDIYQPEQGGYVGIDLLIPGSILLPFLDLLAQFIQTQ